MTEEMGLNVSRKQTLTMPTWRSAAVFHSRAAATGEARSPMVDRRVRRTTSDDVDAERRRWRASSADDWSSSARYNYSLRRSCQVYRHLYTRTASLNLMRSGTFSRGGDLGEDMGIVPSNI